MNGGRDPYGEDHNVEKAKCLNHVAKLFGKKTSQFEKKKHLVFQKKKNAYRGKDKLIDYLQQYFQLNLSKMVEDSR